MTEPDDRADRADRIDGADRADRDERIERADRADRADGADRANRIDGADRADRADGADRADRANRIDGADRIDRADRADRADGTDATDAGDVTNRRAERALRDTLSAHAEAPIFRPLRIDVTTTPRRRWTRWVPAAALIALVALAVPLVISQTTGGSGSSAAVPAAAGSGAERSDATASAAASGPLPSTPGMRWESYRVLSYQVPTSWGYDRAPAGDWCTSRSSSSYGAFVDVAPELRAVASSACPRTIPAARLSMFVTVRAVGSERAWDLPSGWSVDSTELDGYRLEVVHPAKEARVAAEIVASVRPIGEVDPNGCAAMGTSGEPRLATPTPVALCQYQLGQGLPLLASRALSGREAQDVRQALVRAPKGRGPDDGSCTAAGSTFVIVRLAGELGEQDVRVAYSGCQGNGITGFGERELTAEVCQAIMVPPITFTSGSGKAAALCAPAQAPSASPTPSPSTTR